MTKGKNQEKDRDRLARCRVVIMKNLVYDKTRGTYSMRIKGGFEIEQSLFEILPTTDLVAIVQENLERLKREFIKKIDKMIMQISGILK